MISNIIAIGDRIELTHVKRDNSPQKGPKKVYYSQVNDIVSEDEINIAMPMEKGKIILLSIDSVYTLSFFSKNSIYQCNGKIVDRYKSSNMYFLVVELVSSLKKMQRREYYRLECLMPAEFREMTQKEIDFDYVEEIVENAKDPDAEEQELPFQKAIIVDISGGGLRMVSEIPVEANQYVLIKVRIPIRFLVKQFHLVGYVLQSAKVPGEVVKYEIRLQFEKISKEEREAIIKYIFEEERKKRKVEKS